ncbi:hypothetical protein AQUCO_03800119v1 [Aquilegia coerulea]|uniref:Reticulon-like protein n=1 Tax=Aquilegia coerulea TaxID=218851 RepID=A0A2G5CTU0_AQUCA|nr:hypothetical protein AQUCO_03800119v1 [Aquilegia coerulea]
MVVEHVEHSESLMEKIKEKIHGDNSSDSDNDNKKEKPHSSSSSSSPSPSTVKSAINRLFGRQKPVHKVFGGGKPADVFLWRNKKISAGVLGGATAIWVLFELLEYHLLTLVCHCLILVLALSFLWSNAATFVNKSPPQIPNLCLPEKQVVEVASALSKEINCAISVLRDVASGRDVKTFLFVS